MQVLKLLGLGGCSQELAVQRALVPAVRRSAVLERLLRWCCVYVVTRGVLVLSPLRLHVNRVGTGLFVGMCTAVVFAVARAPTHRKMLMWPGHS